MQRYWRIWAKALGEKTGRTDSEADKVAIVRSFLAIANLITCGFIIAGVLRHW
jgi:hypothetical protein